MSEGIVTCGWSIVVYMKKLIRGDMKSPIEFAKTHLNMRLFLAAVTISNSIHNCRIINLNKTDPLLVEMIVHVTFKAVLTALKKKKTEQTWQTKHKTWNMKQKYKNLYYVWSYWTFCQTCKFKQTCPTPPKKPRQIKTVFAVGNIFCFGSVSLFMNVYLTVTYFDNAFVSGHVLTHSCAKCSLCKYINYSRTCKVLQRKC